MACHRRFTALPPRCSPSLRPQFQNYKIIYRRYAGLFFSICVDPSDNELAYLESIHLFVELLDRYFGNVSHLLPSPARHPSPPSPAQPTGV